MNGLSVASEPIELSLYSRPDFCFVVLALSLFVFLAFSKPSVQT
jgi:hypothetical protein